MIDVAKPSYRKIRRIGTQEAKLIPRARDDVAGEDNGEGGRCGR